MRCDPAGTGYDQPVEASQIESLREGLPAKNLHAKKCAGQHIRAAFAFTPQEYSAEKPGMDPGDASEDGAGRDYARCTTEAKHEASVTWHREGVHAAQIPIHSRK